MQPGSQAILCVLIRFVRLQALPNTTFAQNNGVIVLSRCASRSAGIACGVWLILFGVLAKIGGWVSAFSFRSRSCIGIIVASEPEVCHCLSLGLKSLISLILDALGLLAFILYLLLKSFHRKACWSCSECCGLSCISVRCLMHLIQEEGCCGCSVSQSLEGRCCGSVSGQDARQRCLKTALTDAEELEGS